MATIRNTQLDGWRAFAVLGVMWHHWVPASWRGPFPFEIGLFFFLTLTGFLITGILLRAREAGETGGGPWRAKAYLFFQKRRMTRILLPCYVAMMFCVVIGAPDIRAHWPAYFGQWANFHMAWTPRWPSGTAPFWTLAIQIQFYLAWPLVVFFAPGRAMAGVFLAGVLLAPLTRLVLSRWFPEIPHGEAITTSAMDYFGVGALLALAIGRGMRPGDIRLRRAAWLAFAGYFLIWLSAKLGHPVAGMQYFQQSLLSVAFAGLISSTLAGLRGPVGKLLDHRAVQHIGRLSYGLYLFHAAVPMFLGIALPWLWHPVFNGAMLGFRIAAFALGAWGFAYLSWRFLEGGGRAVRQALPRAASGSPDR